MDYMILDNHGNALAALDNEADAFATLRTISWADPEAADSVALFAYDDDGSLVTGPIVLADLPPAATVYSSEWVFTISTRSEGR